MKSFVVTNSSKRETHALAQVASARSFVRPMLSAEVLGLTGIALLAVCVFETAAWLAAAPLTTLVYFVASAPALLFLIAVLSERKL